MKRWIWILAAILLLSGESRIGGRLEDLVPVQLLTAEFYEGKVILKADTGETGIGADVISAAKDMEESAEGKLLLDTVETVVLLGDITKGKKGLLELLRPGTEVWRGIGEIEPEKASEYLTARRSEVSLLDLIRGIRNIPILNEKGGKIHAEYRGTDCTSGEFMENRSSADSGDAAGR